jgi:hypothetical protein
MVYVKHQGATWPVTNMFDIDKEETNDISLATTCVAKMADDEWLALVVCDGDLFEDEGHIAYAFTRTR